MPLESLIVTPADLNEEWPLGADPKSEGDNHIRNLKIAMKAFWDAVGLTELPNGALPVVFNQKMVDAGLGFTTDGVVFNRRLVAPYFIQAGGFDPQSRFLVGMAMTDGENARLSIPVSSALTDYEVQPLFDTINTNPIAFSIYQLEDVWLKGFSIRGAGTQIPYCRWNIKRGGPNGVLIYQTVPDELLKAGGGFTIQPTGSTNIDMGLKIPLGSGDTLYTYIDRWDPDSQAIVTSGIFLRGTVISGNFVPYLATQRQAVTYQEVVRRNDLPLRSVQADHTQQTVSAATVVGSFSYTRAQHDATDFVLRAEVQLDTTANTTYLVEILQGATVIGSGKISTAAGESPVVTALARWQAPGFQAYPFSVRLTPGSGSVSKKMCVLSMLTQDGGDTWA